MFNTSTAKSLDDIELELTRLRDHVSALEEAVYELGYIIEWRQSVHGSYMARKRIDNK